VGTVEEGTFVNGRWVPGRRLAGDETTQGDCVVLRWPPGAVASEPPSVITPSGIQRFTVYRYR